MVKKQGKLFVVVGPSGAGKTTIVEGFMAKKENAELVVSVPSYTTRVPRDGERDGKDYHFITVEEFKRKVAEGFFLEWSAAYKNYYGSSYSEILQLLDNGKSVMVVIDRNGAEQIIKKLSDAIVIYIMPPNETVLRERLQKRGSETGDSFEFRIQQSLKEVQEEQKNTLAQHVVVNHRIDRSIRLFGDIVNRGVLS